MKLFFNHFTPFNETKIFITQSRKERQVNKIHFVQHDKNIVILIEAKKLS